MKRKAAYILICLALIAGCDKSDKSSQDSSNPLAQLGATSTTASVTSASAPIQPTLPATPLPPTQPTDRPAPGQENTENTAQNTEQTTEKKGEQNTANTDTASIELQELTFTSEVKNKEPVDVLEQVAVGMRVWAHLRVRYRGDDPHKLHVEFHVNDSKRTSLDLEVQKSWSYRTWAYNTMRPGDKGKLRFQVTDESGRVLADKELPIGAQSKSKPYVKKQ